MLDPEISGIKPHTVSCACTLCALVWHVFLSGRYPGSCLEPRGRPGVSLHASWPRQHTMAFCPDWIF